MGKFKYSQVTDLSDKYSDCELVRKFITSCKCFS